MYRVQIRNQISGVRIFYGALVRELHDCYKIADLLEEEWRTWQERGFLQLTPDNPIQLLEGSEIYVVSDDGVTYWLNGDCEFETVN